MTKRFAAPLFGVLACASTTALFGAGLGYTDTPLIPGTKWHVHDGERPQPKVVTPGEAGKAPSDAVVLFDGTSTTNFRKGDGSAATWKVEDGAMFPAKGSGDIISKQEFGPDLQVHFEFATPSPASGNGQQRGNSGIFFFGQYEFQVLDTYQNPTYADGQTGAAYGQYPPLVNASRKPGEWQTYDIIFEAPRFNADGSVAKKAVVTILVNGIVLQNRTELMGPTVHKRVGTYRAHGEKGTISFQDHGDPVRLRNIWVRELKPVDTQ